MRSEAFHWLCWLQGLLGGAGQGQLPPDELQSDMQMATPCVGLAGAWAWPRYEPRLAAARVVHLVRGLGHPEVRCRLFQKF